MSISLEIINFNLKPPIKASSIDIQKLISDIKTNYQLMFTNNNWYEYKNDYWNIIDNSYLMGILSEKFNLCYIEQLNLMHRFKIYHGRFSQQIKFNENIKYFIPCTNGTYDLITRTLRDSRPDDYFDRIYPFRFRVNDVNRELLEEILHSLFSPSDYITFIMFCKNFLHGVKTNRILYLIGQSRTKDFIYQLFETIFNYQFQIVDILDHNIQEIIPGVKDVCVFLDTLDMTFHRPNIYTKYIYIQENDFPEFHFSEDYYASFIRIINEYQLEDHKVSKSSETIEHELCAICHEDIDSHMKILTCQHKFHSVCIDRWHRIKNECPYCKVAICSLSSLSPVRDVDTHQELMLSRYSMRSTMIQDTIGNHDINIQIPIQRMNDLESGSSSGDIFNSPLLRHIEGQISIELRNELTGLTGSERLERMAELLEEDYSNILDNSTM